MQKNLKIALCLVAVLAVSSVIVFNLGTATNTPQNPNSPIDSILDNILPDTNAEAAGNFTIDNIQIQEGYKHYSVTWQGINTKLFLEEKGVLYDFPVTDNEVFGITVKNGPIKFYSNGINIITFYP
jgi:hypothetical protein